MKTFVANPTQTREFIANFKQANLSLKHYNVEIDNDEATFSTNTGKVFVVNVSDLSSLKEDKGDSLWAIMCMVDLGAINHETLKSSEAPEKEIYSTHIDDNSPTIGVDESFDENDLTDFKEMIGQIVDDLQKESDQRYLENADVDDYSHSIAPERKLDNESSTSVDDDSHLSIDEVDDFITEINNSYTINQQETALKAAKIVFHYWALSGNSWNVPYNLITLVYLFEVISENTYINFIGESPNMGNVIVNLRFVGDSIEFGDSFKLFLQILDKHAVSCGVHPQFTPSQLSVYQQNYQSIVADCTAILELYRQSTDNDVYKGCEGANDVVFPTNINELFSLVNATCGNKEAIAVVNSIHDEEYLFFQVLDTLNSINQTKSVGILA
jgi:hypothetical protein